MIQRVLAGWFGRLLCLSGLVLMTGCASTEQYHGVEMSQTALAPGRARIYVMRTARFLGDGTAVEVSMSGITRETGRSYTELIGAVGPKHYLCWDAAPGAVTLSIEEGAPGNQKELRLQAGQTYYLRVTMTAGYIGPEFVMESLSDADGKDLLKKCKPPKKQ